MEGVILLPYAEIKEPFTGYWDAINGRSRVDYYGDLVQTVQRADITTNGNAGINYKLAWAPNAQRVPQRVCFQVNGTQDAPVTATTVLPDLTGFNYIRDEDCPSLVWPSTNRTCEHWESISTNGDKESKYVFWLTRGASGEAIPVHYLMKGRNTLFGSHYDEYRVLYRNYVLQPSIDDDVFAFVSNLTCRSYPGPGHAKNVAIHDPIREFIHGVGHHIDSEFDRFKNKHEKNYNDASQHEVRKNAFRNNYRFIESSNRKNVHFKLAVNHLADRTQEELQGLRGRMHTPGYNGGKPFDKTVRTRGDVPDQFDWRLYGAVNPVKDQAVCGSCWSFGTSGTIEGTYFVKTGHLLRVSEQQLIDCSWQQGDNGCDGGEDFRAYSYLQSVGGISLDEDYGGYLGADGKCHDTDVPLRVQINGFVNVTSNDPDALQLAVFENGPVTIGIDASQPSFSFYSSGVYYDANCGNTPDSLDHQVLVVGYGTLYGQRYWLVRNSWSTWWGNDGYILMAQKDNNCGVMTSPTYPLIDV